MWLIIVNGISTDRFSYAAGARSSVREKHGIKENQFAAGYIGRFSEQKNHADILEIFEEVLTQ